MDLIIFRHGIAVDREDWSGPDHLRPLTTEGHQRTTAVVRSAADLLSRIDIIWSSPWVRALQTASIVAQEYAIPTQEILELAGDLGHPDALVALLAAAEADHIMMVGHEPDLSILASYLIGGGDISLKKAGIITLNGYPEAGHMSLTGLYQPKALVGSKVGLTPKAR